MGRHVVIWDGIAFREVTPDVAKQLVAEDKAQLLDGSVDGGSLKYRRQFTGYHPKPEPEVVVSPEPETAPEPEAPPPEEVEVKACEGEVDPMAKAVKTEPMKDWRTYRKVAAEALGKPLVKVTKAEVLKWLEDNE